MDASRWQRVKTIFSTLADDGSVTDETILEACEGDVELASEVRPLIDEHCRLQSTLEREVEALEPRRELPRQFAGRYRVVSWLGSGSFGDVYRVIDEQAGNCELALKVLRSPNPDAVQHFKREFRSLADIYHRNIVRLHELHFHADRWMFTMEYVDGVNLLKYLANCSDRDKASAIQFAMLQLADGLAALHQRKLLHRDVKPSNILVTPSGRLVLLDFGLVRAFGNNSQSTASFAGTPEYMAPEQASGETLAESSDWYSVGVLLYQCLTGRLPFEGNVVEVFHRKQFERATPPAELVPEVKEDLNALCQRLLERDPATRASYSDVVRWARGTESRRSHASVVSRFVGRDKPLKVLNDAFAVAADRPTVVHLRGPSGIGKTTLIRQFMTTVEENVSALVFAGRCYEGETLPYQALDDLIDHIGQYLRRLPRGRSERLLPRNFSILAKMFPILAPLLPVDTRSVVGLSSVELRTRALAALRELLGRMSEHHRVVLVIDDLQWGDLDGCVALKDLLKSVDAPPVLVVLTYRSEDADVAEALAELSKDDTKGPDQTSLVIDLEHLDDSETRELATSLLTEPVGEAILTQIGEQAAGNPFLVQEIVRWIQERPNGPVLDQPFSLADVVRSKLNLLTPASGNCLELLAVSGQPTALSLLQLAAGISDLLSARDELIHNHLLRSRSVGGHEEVEIYHDRIRAIVLADMAEVARIRGHRQLARALESAGAHDLERIAVHYEQAGDVESCVRYALMAAHRASDVLAFNDAARFYEMAIRTGTLAPDELRAVHRDCADALANAGRGPDAAMHYSDACDGASADEQLEGDLRAAEQWLYSGYVDRGLAIFGRVLKQIGIRVPKKSNRLPIDLLARRVRLRIRGLRWRERQASEIPRNVLLEIDACAAVATGLALIDVARGAALQTTSLLLALSAGEPSRIARCLAMEAGYRSAAGVSAQAKVADLLERARELSMRTGDHRAHGLTSVMAAACAWNFGSWEDSYRKAREARDSLSERYERLTWERNTAAIFEVDALRWMGRWAIMQEILPELLEDARYRGDLYVEAILQMHSGSCAALAKDDPDRALSGLQILNRWSSTGFHIQHLIAVHNHVEIALYRQCGSEAWDHVVSNWPALQRSLLMRVENFGIQLRSLRARAALSAAAAMPEGSRRRELLLVADRESRHLRLKRARWANGLGELVSGALEQLDGRPDRALVTLTRAEDTLGEARMLLHQVAARRARGLILGGDEGRVLVASADQEFLAQAILNPDSMMHVMVPG
jgi:eukaryotic-like serine/threonine-protein kinase